MKQTVPSPTGQLGFISPERVVRLRITSLNVTVWILSSDQCVSVSRILGTHPVVPRRNPLLLFTFYFAKPSADWILEATLFSLCSWTGDAGTK